MSLYGYEILQALIVDVEPDDQVKSSMNEINAGLADTSIVFLFLPTKWK